MIDLFNLITKIESAGNQHAVRFEPRVYQRLITGAMTPAHAAIVANIRKIHNCSTATAQMIYSTSFGAVQIMGFNLYDKKIDCRQSFVNYLCDIALQQTMFNRFLKTIDLDHYNVLTLANDNHARLEFAIKYNGSIDYVYAMKRELAAMGANVV